MSERVLLKRNVMTRSPLNLIARLVVIATVLAAVQLAGHGTASACSVFPPFELPVEYLAGPDLNDPSSQVAADYAEYSRDADPLPDIVGGYVTETIHTVEPVDEWTRGSVTIVTHMWGEVPDRRSWVVNTVNLEGVEFEDVQPGDCGPSDRPRNGPPLGRRDVTVVFDDASASELVQVVGTDAEIESALTTAFGEPLVIDRDATSEQEMLDKLLLARGQADVEQAVSEDSVLGQDDGSSSLLLLVGIGAGVALVAGGVLGYRRRGTPGL